ncbi:MAG: 4Fe-4S dicluster domain-containing protein [Thermosphaera sp.]
MVRYAIVVDITKCNGCYNCFLACKDEFWDNDWLPYSVGQPRHGHQWIRLLYKERGNYPHVRITYVPMLCFHCESPSCLKAAKEGAVYKRPDGIVIIDPVKSKGQKQLIEACPYGNIFWNEEKNVPQKCTMCVHLLEQGWREPRCVQACPTSALKFGDLDDPRSEVYKLVKSGQAVPFKPEVGLRSGVFYIGLHRYTKELLAGSVALKDSDEIAKGAKVTLVNKKTGEKTVTETNEFGLFEFDGLELGSYSLTVEYPGYKPKTIDIDLSKSIYIGYIELEK